MEWLWFQAARRAAIYKIFSKIAARRAAQQYPDYLVSTTKIAALQAAKYLL
jgi:hypothetical protein